jgi:hypothetical protein
MSPRASLKIQKTPAKKEPAKPICRWYLAEDVRTEVGGKLSLMGLIPTDKLLIEMPPEIPDPTPEQPIALDGLTVLCVLSGFTGTAEFELTLGEKNPSASSTALTRTVVIESHSTIATANLVSRFRPVLLQSFGEKEFTISSTALNFSESFTFVVERRDINLPPEPAPQISLAPLAAPVAALNTGTKVKRATSKRTAPRKQE